MYDALRTVILDQLQRDFSENLPEQIDFETDRVVLTWDRLGVVTMTLRPVGIAFQPLGTSDAAVERERQQLLQQAAARLPDLLSRLAIFHAGTSDA
jgi:hypothetical protein